MPQDDPAIGDDALLYRRIHPRHLIWDDNEGRIRPSSNAVNPVEMSVNHDATLNEDGHEPSWVLRKDPEHHLSSVTAHLARELGQAVWLDPLDEEAEYGPDQSHAIVEGKKKGSKAGRLAKEATVEIVRRASLQADVVEKLGDTALPGE